VAKLPFCELRVTNIRISNTKPEPIYMIRNATAGLCRRGLTRASCNRFLRFRRSVPNNRRDQAAVGCM